MIFKLTDGTYATVEEYQTRHESYFKDEIYYTTDIIQQAQYIQMLKDHGIEAMVADHPIDSAYISHMEAEREQVKFKRVDSNVSDLLKESHEEDLKDIEENF